MASGLTVPFAYTQLLRMETRNALRLAIFRGDLTNSDADMILDMIDADVRSGALNACSLPWVEVFAEAEKLGRLHTAELGTRSLDILHVAAAVVLGASLFLTFDKRQGELARKAGLEVKPR
jgi:predicted nucleic acid-binding protein